MTLTRRLFAILLLFAPLSPVAAQVPGDLTLTSLGVSVSTPVAVRHANDGSNRLFVVERLGTILIYEPGTGLLGAPFLNITSRIDDFFEGGLLGLAFHPDFTTNRYFYVYYTRTGSPLETVVERFEVPAGTPNDADETTGVEIFTLDQPAGNHNGGDIHFGPDGFLYIGLGDGGPSGTAQQTNNLLGKMLRIDPCDTASCAQPYTIPASNPFVGVAGTADEIWSIGLRNPYRWSFDRDTGDMLIADVGQSSREEVNVEPAGMGGLNYGWNCREGDIAGPGGCSGTFVEPEMVYNHSGGNCSITGGYRYRGCIQGLQGTYVFADFCTARVFFGSEDTPGNWSFSQWDDLSGSVFGFGEDEAGELYLLQASSIFRFESASDCVGGGLFTEGFESGDLSAWDTTVP